ncbi:MAG: hypothetical protein EBY39_03025, partial [Flavobacteriia bacterium]|nr:hypothetical protein [Flavobacteriia bacterium]
MEITLKHTDEQVELVKAMASSNRDVAYEAQAALARFIAPVLAQVVNQAPTLANKFQSFSFNSEDNPSFPLDLYYDVTDEDYIYTWSQSLAGGLPTNQVQPTHSEMKFTTYRLDSAISFDKRYASKSRMDVIGKSMTRLAQEIMIKQEATSANLVLGALAEAKTDGVSHIHESSNGRIMLEDFNKLITLSKRIHKSWYGGTPDGGSSRGVTDLLVSPEIVEDLRSLAYNPVNTSAGVKVEKGTGNGVTDSTIAATDSMRESLWSNSGIGEFFGIRLQEFSELGKDQRFNDVFAQMVTAAGGKSAVSSFNTSSDQLVIGLDASVSSLWRAVATDSETGSEMNLAVDDQYSVRQGKIGYYGSLEEGRVI